MSGSHHHHHGRPPRDANAEASAVRGRLAWVRSTFSPMMIAATLSSGESERVKGEGDGSGERGGSGSSPAVTAIASCSSRSIASQVVAAYSDILEGERERRKLKREGKTSSVERDRFFFFFASLSTTSSTKKSKTKKNRTHRRRRRRGPPCLEDRSGLENARRHKLGGPATAGEAPLRRRSSRSCSSCSRRRRRRRPRRRRRGRRRRPSPSSAPSSSRPPRPGRRLRPAPQGLLGRGRGLPDLRQARRRGPVRAAFGKVPRRREGGRAVAGGGGAVKMRRKRRRKNLNSFVPLHTRTRLRCNLSHCSEEKAPSCYYKKRNEEQR